MFISASRRTDLPGFYSDWFFARLREGYALVRNPMNPHQVSRIDLRPGAVDGIVFWTKNPVPMLDRLPLLTPYAYYFQFTLTAYGRDTEPHLPDKRGVLLPAFDTLAARLGPERVVWRYDPIFLSERYTLAYHIRCFTELAERLRGRTKRCTISFLDFYRNTRSNLEGLRLRAFPQAEQLRLASALAEIARRNCMEMTACAEALDLAPYGVGRAHCVDGALFERLLGCSVTADKDKNQRPECGCMASVDLGAYQTCRNGCRYCYANHSARVVAENAARHDPASPLLLGALGPDDVVRERPARSCRAAQLRLDGT